MKTAYLSETTERLTFPYNVVILEQHTAKSFKISIGFFSLQDKPVLLMPWMVYTVVFLILETVLYIIIAAQYFKMGLSYEGAVSLVVAVIYIRK
jgi:hypothetical protein